MTMKNLVLFASVWLGLTIDVIALSPLGLPRLGFRVGSHTTPTLRPTSTSTSTSTRLYQQEIEWDEEEFESEMSYDEYVESLKKLARVTSREPDAVERAEKLFDQLLQTYLQEEDSQFWPQTEVYNLILEIHAYSPHEDGADQAAVIVERMESQQNGIAPPNVETYGQLMDAWTRRRNLEKTVEVVDHMKSIGIEPTIRIYNKLIKAHGKVGKADEAKAILEDLLVQNNPKVFPNQKTWVQVLRGYSTVEYSRSGAGLEMIQQLMGRMAEGYRSDGHANWKPGVLAYNALLKAMSLQPKSNVEAEAVLYSMLEQYNAGEENMRPTSDSFYHVLMSFFDAKGRNAAEKVQKLLELQSGLSNGPNDYLRITTRNYNACMAALSRTSDPLKALKVRQVFDRYKDESNPDLQPSEFSYVSLLNACAFTKTGPPNENMATFTVAVDALREVQRGEIVTPTEKMYSLFLRACERLMPSSPKRDKVVEQVFAACVSAGFSSTELLRQFDAVASPQLLRRVVE